MAQVVWHGMGGIGGQRAGPGDPWSCTRGVGGIEGEGERERERVIIIRMII